MTRTLSSISNNEIDRMSEKQLSLLEKSLGLSEMSFRKPDSLKSRPMYSSGVEAEYWNQFLTVYFENRKPITWKVGKWNRAEMQEFADEFGSGKLYSADGESMTIGILSRKGNVQTMTRTLDDHYDRAKLPRNLRYRPDHASDSFYHDVEVENAPWSEE